MYRCTQHDKPYINLEDGSTTEKSQNRLSAIKNINFCEKHEFTFELNVLWSAQSGMCVILLVRCNLGTNYEMNLHLGPFLTFFVFDPLRPSKVCDFVDESFNKVTSQTF